MGVTTHADTAAQHWDLPVPDTASGPQARKSPGVLVMHSALGPRGSNSYIPEGRTIDVSQ